MKKHLKKNSGITLITLVITIIILLILAGLSISAITGSGLFGKASEATDKYNKAKARETLELVLEEAFIQKYDEGLTEEQLDKKIQEIGELEEKEDSNPNIQNVIVEGHIFKIDKSVPKIIDYVAPADGIVIKAKVNIIEESGWAVKAQIIGKIKTYSGGTIKNVSTKRDNVEISGFSMDADGNYIIDNIKDNGIYTIYAEDSNEKNAMKEIAVEMNVDKIPPTINSTKATPSLKKIKISATATDKETGLKQISYSVTPTTISPKTGTLTSGQPITLTATETREYTITFTATDNSGNTTTKTIKATTSNAISVEDAKATINTSNIKNYIGKEVNYKPQAGGTWRVFYYDETGYFGTSKALYLKRDTTSETVNLQQYKGYNPSDGGNIMKKMNPLWAKHAAGKSIDLYSEHCCSWLNDPSRWTNYKTSEANFAIGTPSLEMFCKSYGQWCGNANYMTCTMVNNNGYGITGTGAYGTHPNSGLNRVCSGTRKNISFL